MQLLDLLVAPVRTGKDSHMHYGTGKREPLDAWLMLEDGIHRNLDPSSYVVSWTGRVNSAERAHDELHDS